jgi:hypothetical protein
VGDWDMSSDLTNDQRALAEAMSDLSEAGYHAGWMAGLEYDLWRILLTGGISYGQHEVSQGDISRLRDLAEKCGGWIVFDDDKGEIFVPMVEWQKMFAAHAAKIARRKNDA